MALHPLPTILLPPDSEILLERVATDQGLRLLHDAVDVGVATSLDTFDGRLARRDLALQHERCGRARNYLLMNSESVPLEVRATGRYAGGLRPAALPCALQAAVAAAGERRLLPVFEHRFERVSARLLDSRDKTIVTLTIWRGQVCAAAGLDAVAAEAPVDALQQAPLICRVRALKGYEPQAAHFADAIIVAHGVRVTPSGAVEALALAAGIDPRGFSSKLKLELHAQMSAGQALAELLRLMWWQMCVTETGTCQSTDSEFLHDFRVAIRRARSWLARLKTLVEVDVLAELNQELRWLGSVSGPVRDLDVYAVELDEYLKLLPGADARALNSLAAHVARSRRGAQRRLVLALRSDRYQQFMLRFEHILQRMAEGGEGLSHDAAQPVRDVAIAAIRRQWRRVRREGRRIGPETAAEALHDLRIECKKLRYLLEAFESLFPEAATKVWLKGLKRLQDHLGSFQDLEVQRERLKVFATEMDDRGRATVDSLLAMGRLTELLSQRQAAERQRFADRWRRFDCDAVNVARKQHLR
ncbi:MAG: CHAD domain-containing protein [Pseudomonadota bacterium]